MVKSQVPLNQIFVSCEALYQRDGFVKWADVAKIHGLSRQAIPKRMERAIATGELDQATYDRWSSMSSRRAILAQRRTDTRHNENQKSTRLTFTEDNANWLRTECEVRQCTRADIINGLINKARTGR
jgi:hypothetical protein